MFVTPCHKPMQIVELDAQRNRNREALRQLHKLSKSPVGLEDKSWVCLGNTFIKMRSKHCVNMLEKGECVLIGVDMAVLQC